VGLGGSPTTLLWRAEPAQTSGIHRWPPATAGQLVGVGSDSEEQLASKDVLVSGPFVSIWTGKFAIMLLKGLLSPTDTLTRGIEGCWGFVDGRQLS